MSLVNNLAVSRIQRRQPKINWEVHTTGVDMLERVVTGNVSGMGPRGLVSFNFRYSQSHGLVYGNRPTNLPSYVDREVRRKIQEVLGKWSQRKKATVLP